MKRLSNAIETQHTGMENKDIEINRLSENLNEKDAEIARISVTWGARMRAKNSRIEEGLSLKREEGEEVEEEEEEGIIPNLSKLTSKHAESSLQGEMALNIAGGRGGGGEDVYETERGIRKISRLSAQLKTLKDRELHNVRHAKSQSSLQVQRLIESHNKEMELSKKRCEARIEIAEKRSRELRKVKSITTSEGR
eukprot:jgi/Bigna1/144705/aug1.90_g19413